MTIAASFILKDGLPGRYDGPAVWICLRGIVLVVLCMSLWAQPSALADDPLADAKAHFEKGQRLFKVSRYREALEEFKEGFVAKADPVFLFNIAQCHRLLGERSEALTFYRRYLKAAPKVSNREDIERRIRELEVAEAAEPAASKPMSATPASATAPPSLTPSPTVPPSLSGETTRTTVLTIQSPPPEPPIYKRWWVWAGAAAVVAAGVTTVLLLRRPSPCGGAVDTCVGL